MNHVYIGDRQLEPPEDNGCEFCDGLETIGDCVTMTNHPCRHCQPDQDNDFEDRS